MKILAGEFLFLGITAALATGDPDQSLHARLGVWNQLFSNYNAQLHPENVTVQLGIDLLHVDLDAETGLMEAHLWVRMVWNDTRLQWDQNRTSVNTLRVPPSQVWTPDIALHNGISPKMTLADFNVVISPNGQIVWVPHTVVKSFCDLSLTTEPLAEQSCVLKFESWTHDGYTLDLQPYKDKLMVDLFNFYPRKYAVTNNTARRNVILYTCCDEPFLDITYVLGLTRRTGGSPTNCSATE